eukprot:COSAG01_NODE_43372_length_430_cov_1.099698_2_plen_47_part_01
MAETIAKEKESKAVRGASLYGWLWVCTIACCHARGFRAAAWVWVSWR